MAIDIDQSHYNTGTATVEADGLTVTGQGTAWIGSVRRGDLYGTHRGAGVRIEAVNSSTSLTLAYAIPDLDQTAAPYEIQRTPFDVGYLRAIEDIIRLMGQGALPELAAVDGTGGDRLIMMTGPKTAEAFEARRLINIAALTSAGVIELAPNGDATVVPKSELVSGVEVDARVQTLPDRAAFDGQPEQFSVYVNDIGGGIAAVYFKKSNASADWSTPAIQTGPEGAASTVPGVVWRGAYAGATLYAINDGVTFNGSSFRKLTTAAAGTAPSSASPPVDTAAWEVLAAKGANGTGTGDFVGPASSVADEVVLFADATGKEGKRGPLIQTTAQDDTAGRLMSVGAFGLGGQLVTLDTECNNYKTAGVYITPGAMTNAPPGFTSRIILKVGGGSSYASQTAFDTASGRTATRISLAGGTTWSPWDLTHNDGEVVASYYAAYSLYFSGAAVVPVDDTPPLVTEGVQLATITTAALKSTTNKLRIRFASLVGADTVTAAVLWINVNGNPAVRTSYGVIRAAGDLLIAAGEYEFTPGSKSAVTVALRAGAQAGNLRLNGITSRLFGGSTGASLVVEEIKA